MATELLVLLGAYLLGSIPTALLVSQRAVGIDIRTVGDRNMGARNVSRTLGWKLGLMVAIFDVIKGFTAVQLARLAGLGLGWQMAAATFAVLGHDFPVFANLRGGQGFAASVGTLLALTPLQSLIGLGVYGAIYLVTRKPDLSASLGIGLLVLLLWLLDAPRQLLVWAVLIILSIPAKKLFDRQQRISAEEEQAVRFNHMTGSRS